MRAVLSRIGQHRSVEFCRIGPSRKAGYGVKLSKKAAQELIGVVFRAERFDAGEDSGDCSVGLGNGLFRVILPLALKAASMPEKLFPIEVSVAETVRSKSSPGLSVPCDSSRGTYRGKTSLNAPHGICQRIVTARREPVRRATPTAPPTTGPSATTKPPRQPSAIPPPPAATHRMAGTTGRSARPRRT